MSGGSSPLGGHPGSNLGAIPELFGGDPSVAPGLPRPIGWRVMMPDGSGAWDKVGPADTDWIAVGAGSSSSSSSTALASLQNQIATINGNLRHPYIWCDCLTELASPFTPVDYVGSGAVFVGLPQNPSTVSLSAALGTPGAPAYVLPLGQPALVGDIKRATWGIGSRSRVVTWNNTGKIALVAMLAADGSIACLGMNHDVSDTFLSTWLMNPANATIGNPQITTQALAPILGKFVDVAAIWDNIAFSSYIGDQRTGVPLARIGQQEDGQLLNELSGEPCSMLIDPGHLNVSEVDYFYGTTVLTP